MTHTKDDWPPMVVWAMTTVCPKCEAKNKKFGTCTRRCDITRRLVQPGEKCSKDYWEGDQDA